MNVDDSWSDATSPTISKPSKPPIDAHAIIASTSGIAEKSAPHAIINRCMPATMQKATAENPRSEAAANTAVVVRSMESNLVDNPRPVAAASTAIVSSMGSNSGKHPALVDTAQVDTPPLSDNARKPFISSKVILKELDYSSSLRNNLYNFMQEQTKEHNELIKTFEGARLTIEQQHNSALAQVWGELEGGARAVRAYEKHVQQELHDHDMIIAKQRAMIEELNSSLNMLRTTLSSQFTRLDADGNVKFAQLAEEHGAALEDLQAGFGMLQAKLDCEITRVNAEKEAQFVALMQKFEGALHQVEASRSQIQMQKEAEVAALAQKFEDALRQVEVSKSQIQAEKETEVAALAQKFEDALRQVKVSKSQIQMEKETEVAALAQKFEGALCQVEVLNRSQQLSHSTQP
ncbi:hypothetical protein EDC04DRAFT_2907814 [Pisolithus marmoratus]|nr:hypothetical protein EDC04DRAFT_2907814 [Pisolithus marmoratus]